MDSSLHPSSLLDEARRKVRRGKEHSYVLDTELRKFWDSKPGVIVHEYDAARSKNLYRFKELRTAPTADWALIIGDVVHNARSALDYVAWRLAGSNLSDTQTLFPICRCDTDFTEAVRRRKLDTRIHGGAISAIREFQPYNRPDLEKAPLWLLEELDIRDKHKLLTPVHHFVFASSVVMDDPLPLTVFAIPNSQLQDDAIVAESPGSNNPNIKIKMDISGDILFERGVVSTTGDYEVCESLAKILDAVDLVIARFDWLLFKNPAWIRS